jgi:tetratricopeptide (TPR) repeat protein
MRLLHFNEAETLVLTNFRGKIIPPYAILSHRWEGSEILYADLENGAYKEKDSIRKLQFCANRAALDGLQYFWIDTCCIDKWDLDELSSSINSMFRWYADATRCYVFLSDVSGSAVLQTSQRDHWEAAFRASKWFTRGWTLQELVAPVSVEFFSCEGHWIGNKVTLEQLVHEITSIPITALQNRSLEKFTASERMDWAKSRETTEEEDRAYCLLGILGVTMTPDYGEGGTKAFERLRGVLEAIGSAPSIIPFSRNDRFVGRESELAELQAKLSGSLQSTTLAITGAVGTGKSQVALELAYRLEQSNKDWSIFWIDATDKESLHRSYASIVQKVQIPGWNDEKSGVFQLLKTYFGNNHGTRCLLVFDGVRDETLQSGSVYTSQQVDEIGYLPQSEMCSIVLTTLHKDVSAKFASQQVVELKGLTPDMAQEMLEKLMDATIPANEGREATLLLQGLSHLPLAIVQAASYMRTRNTTLQEYRSRLSEQTETAPEGVGALARDPVAATLFVSLDQVRRDSTLAADYLLLAACVKHKDIPLDLLEAPSPWEREDALRVLSCYALIIRRPGNYAFDIHRTAHDALRAWLQEQDLRDQWSQQAITRLLLIFPHTENNNRSRWRRLLPHAMCALSYNIVEREGSEKLGLTSKCAMALYRDGRYGEAETLFLPAIDMSERIHGKEHHDTLVTRSNLASVYFRQGRWQEAKEMQIEILQRSETVLGETHPSTLTHKAHLALTYSNQGQLAEAERLEVYVMNTRMAVLGEEHPDTLTSMGNLASSYRSQGRWGEAENLEKRAVEIRTSSLGGEHNDTLTSMGELASTYWHMKQYQKAEDLQEHVLEIRRRVLGDKHRDTLTSMANLASTYFNQYQWEKAAEMLVEVQQTSTQVLGEQHPDTLTSTQNLASAYYSQGKWGDAEEMFLQVQKMFEKVHGMEHPATLMVLSNLAIVVQLQGRTDEAISRMETCIKMRERSLGSHHPDTEELRRILNGWRREELSSG